MHTPSGIQARFLVGENFHFDMSTHTNEAFVFAFQEKNSDKLEKVRGPSIEPATFVHILDVFNTECYDALWHQKAFSIT